MSGTTVDNAFGRVFELLSLSGYKLDMEKRFSGHSGRIGLLFEANSNGMNRRDMQQIGDWASERMLNVYLREYDNSDIFNSLQQ